ncbi:MAG: ABC-ATPase UvrA, partial [Planctomycetaceae bacterium]
SHQDDGEWHDRLFSTRFACPDCELSFQNLELRSFSFNSPYGACPSCRGLGHIAPDDDEDAEPTKLCADCNGVRLASFPRSVQIGGRTIGELSDMTVEAMSQFCDQLLATAADHFDGERYEVALQTLPEIGTRLKYLQQVGLGYLTLQRTSRSLSGGEFQRARLARCLGSGLTGACYILDEPTVGLHPRDTHRLIQSMEQLRDLGNSVVVVEHDPDVLRAADHIIDMGPGAGADGGQLIAEGDQSAVQSVHESETGRFLRGELRFQESESSLLPADLSDGPAITIANATQNNLRGVDARFPINALTCVTGVSGSGKSSLVIDTLAPIARAVINRKEAPTGLCDSIEGLDAFQRVLECDARPLGKSGRTNPATYTGLWGEIRKLFAMTRESRIRGFTARRFSFNVKEGNCSECRGQGVNRVKMKFMPDILVPCHVCRGARFNRQTLSIRFNGLTVADVLNMRIDAAADHFSNFDRIHRMLQTFCDIGLGYLALGQPAHTLSGGEAQRVKLANELGQTTRGSSLFILDEPTSGLHAVDVFRLIKVLKRLVDAGHTVVVIEHNEELIRAADWIVSLGPEAGEAGGQVVQMGPPDEQS